MAYFDKDKKHYIQTDTSLKGLGAVLLQDGHPVVYASRSLTPAEKQYSNIERELLAVVFAMERLHHYVYGYTVTVETDHKPLVSIWCKTIATASPRLQHLLLRLAQYDLDTVYLKVKKNVIADALSSISPKRGEEHNSQELEVIPIHYITSTVPADSIDYRNIELLHRMTVYSVSCMKSIMDGQKCTVIVILYYLTVGTLEMR